MRYRLPAICLCSVLSLSIACSLRAQTGSEPALSFGARDVFAEYHLAPLPVSSSGAGWRAAQGTQVLERARTLGITSRSATEAWMEAEATYARAKSAAEQASAVAPVLFRGSTISALNALLANGSVHAVRVLAPVLTLDKPIAITRDHIELDLGGTQLRTDAKSFHAAYMVRVEGAHDVRIRGGDFVQGRWGILIAHSRYVLVTNVSMHSLSGGGILLTSSRDCAVWRNRFAALGEAAVMLHGDTTDTVVAHNDISHLVGVSNWHAGIVLTDRNTDLTTNPESILGTGWFAPADEMRNRTHIPHDNVVAFNDITGNKSSGVYSDGAARTVIAGNRIERNSKEGLCLDDGSLGNAVVYNTVQANGKRWGMADIDLQHDAVLSFGRLPDGTAPAKLPGVSIDNSAYNQVAFNQINANYGSGVKMVRTSYFNVIGLNTITDDNEGRSARFHFFGVELGSARADGPAKDLDFLPSRGNLIFRNNISGNHYAGIFFADGSEHNFAVDNSIFGATDWAMESVKVQPNVTLNNLTNQHSRNISPGTDPVLPKLNAGIFDKH